MATEKRFTLTERKCYFTSLIFDNQENEKMGSDEAMECLNALHDENEQLKHDATVLIYSNQEYRKENQQLKLQLSNISAQRDEFHRGARENANRVGKLKKENEQLKSTIKEVTELLVEEVDVFSEKATEHDINAYIELKELDNKDAFYMAIATKAIKMLKELI